MKKDYVPSGSDVSAGTFKCTNCGYKISIQSKTSLPPCPKCKNGSWKVCIGVGDAGSDPYPNN
jgi:Zn finger protein HypA/HybF involved in hydrogenase expression